MDIEGEDLEKILERMREKSLRLTGRRLLREARQRIAPVCERIEAVSADPEGMMAALDARFEPSQTFLPSTLVRTQLRLAIHYVQAADKSGSPVGNLLFPTLPSYVVLRAAIECTSTAHWLLSGKDHRERVERVLKRMWWDTSSAVDMATTADGVADQTALDDVRARIETIARPIKALDVAKIVDSKRVSLSRIVSEASAALRPGAPTIMWANWMLCSGIAHGNIPVSAGAGVSASLIERPADHLIDDGAYGYVFSSVLEDLESTVDLFESRAKEQHAHQRSRGGESAG